MEHRPNGNLRLVGVKSDKPAVELGRSPSAPKVHQAFSVRLTETTFVVGQCVVVRSAQQSSVHHAFVVRAEALGRAEPHGVPLANAFPRQLT